MKNQYVINDLHIKKALIDYEKDIFILYTLDRNIYPKNYYLPLSELNGSTLEEQIVHVAEYGYKYFQE